jgi:hypothetical protein
LSEGEFGGVHGRGMEHVSQFETEVLRPLRQDLPELLAPRGMRTPAIYVLLLVFISKRTLERSPMEIEIDHIGRSERAWWQGRVAHLVESSADGGEEESYTYFCFFGAGFVHRCVT